MKSEKIVKILLEKKAIAINTENPFTFVSGTKSPIYCDNRSVIAYPRERREIVNAFIHVMKRFDFEIVAGTATAGIPWASWISDELHKPLAYIRSSKKGHGTGNQIEGAKVSGKSVVIIEDLISTGGSSFSAVEAVREAGGMCTGVVAIFTYEFQSAIRKFLEGKCELVTLTSFSTLMHVAKESGTLNDRELKIVLDWHENPQDWRR